MIRFAQPGDEPGLMAVYNACFPGEEGFCRWFFERIYRPQNTLLWQDGDILAAVQLLPVRLTLGGHEVSATYIYAAGTLPQERGKGLMGALLERSFAVSGARGDALSVLITQEPSLVRYYARFAYRPVFARQEHIVAARPLPAGMTVRRMRQDDIPAAQALYCMAHSGLCAVRAPAAWRVILEQYGTKARVLERGGRVTAFALVEAEDDCVTATEALGKDAPVLMAALAHAGKTADARWYGPARNAAEAAVNGCARPLNAEGASLLDTAAEFGYLNVLFN